MAEIKCEFIKFLKDSKQSLANFTSFRTIHIILGNESCDLDSTVSTLALSYLYYHKVIDKTTDLILPVMNVPKRFFSLRTETNYLLNKVGIDPHTLIYRDQVDFDQIMSYFDSIDIQTTLVDHHILTPKDQVLSKSLVKIYDHRPLSQSLSTSDKVTVNIKLVGSCSTLIGQDLLSNNSLSRFPDMAYLIYATILYDTIGLSERGGRTTSDDLKVIEQLETIPTIQGASNRQILYDTLWQIHNDTSGIKAGDLLYRDLKVVHHDRVPIAGLPMLASDYLERSDSGSALEEFWGDFGDCLLVILVGIDASDTSDVRRDVVIYCPKGRSEFRDLVIGKLLASDLGLGKVGEGDSWVCFRQGNVKLTRKYILPIVESVVVD